MLNVGRGKKHLEYIDSLHVFAYKLPHIEVGQGRAGYVAVFKAQNHGAGLVAHLLRSLQRNPVCRKQLLSLHSDKRLGQKCNR